MSRTVSRLFNTHTQAMTAVSELEGAGVPHRDISLVARKVGYWHAHTFIAGHVVVRAGDRLEVLAAPTGKVVAAFPR